MPHQGVWFALVLAVGLSGCAGGSSLEATRQRRVSNDPAAMLRVAQAAEQSGDGASAGIFYRRVAALRPDLPAAQLGVARSLAEQGKMDEAAAVLREAHVRAPSNTQVSATLGRMLVATHRPNEAVAVFREGLQQDPKSASLLIGQGVALDTLGQHEAAQASYKLALQVDPDSVAGHTDLALSLSMSRQSKTAASPVAPKPALAARDSAAPRLATTGDPS